MRYVASESALAVPSGTFGHPTRYGIPGGTFIPCGIVSQATGWADALAEAALAKQHWQHKYGAMAARVSELEALLERRAALAGQAQAGTGPSALELRTTLRRADEIIVAHKHDRDTQL